MTDPPGDRSRWETHGVTHPAGPPSAVFDPEVQQAIMQTALGPVGGTLTVQTARVRKCMVLGVVAWVAVEIDPAG